MLYDLEKPATDEIDEIFIDEPQGEKKEKLVLKLKRLQNKVFRIVRSLKNDLQMLADDVRAVRERDPASRNNKEVILLSSGVHALAAYRVAHVLHQNGLFFSARLISQAAKMITGIEIHPGATIGRGLLIDHGTGVVIGETAQIGENCTIYQGVTLGGTGKDVGKRHPTLGDNVMVGAGAKVLGPFFIGDNTKIAANAVVLEEIPESCTAVGIPAKIVRRQGERVYDDLDQIHIPDPVAQQMKMLEEKLDALQEELNALKNEKKTKKKAKEETENAAL